MTGSGLGGWKEACGLDEVAKIQAFLVPEYQIKIYDKDAFNRLIYKGTCFHLILNKSYLCNLFMF